MSRMVKVLIITMVFISSAFAAWDSIRQKGRILPGNIPEWTQDGELADSGVNVAAMTNAAVIANYLSTNEAATIEFTSRKNVANGYAGLDANGTLDPSLVPDVLVLFDGGHRE